MQNELVRRISESDYCLTYKPLDKTWFVKHFTGEEAGAIYAEITTKKKVEDQSTAGNDFKFLLNKMNNILEPKGMDMKKFRTWITESLFLIKDDHLGWLKDYEEYLIEEEQKEQDKIAEQEEEEISEGFEFLDKCPSPLTWIANEIDWFTAGERMNILYAFLAYCSQVVLSNPISVVATGEGGSGKTHILDTALSLIPDEFVMTIKSTTDAALYGYCDIDPWIFDGKIVNIGDMGGKDDHKEAQEFKNAMKEMQSDGFMARVKREQCADGSWENKVYELHGFPCLTYTNVPGYLMDDQEMSRSIMLTPRDDNTEAVSVYKQIRDLKGTPSEQNLLKHESNKPLIKRMIKALRARLDEVNIVNPYGTVVDKFLDKSKYVKRDSTKYNGIIKVITAINGYKREIIEHDGNRTLMTTKEDIYIFLDILERYHESIASNLSPGAGDVLQDIRDLESKLDLYEEGFTVIDYMYNSNMTGKLSKRSVQTYFSELNAAGFLKVVDNLHRQNVYVLCNDINLKDKINLTLAERDLKILEYNYYIKDFDVTPYTYNGEVLQTYKPPYWNDFLPENS